MIKDCLVVVAIEEEPKEFLGETEGSRAGMGRRLAQESLGEQGEPGSQEHRTRARTWEADSW